MLIIIIIIIVIIIILIIITLYFATNPMEHGNSNIILWKIALANHNSLPYPANQWKVWKLLNITSHL
ncbi:hypothetical protein E2C01_042725 [Portunus trituberculatus]|uniref:Uncharacterized protein n=1 Tax=Portunus trituberculatus TaxID=210409 RepID=A0A5B7FVK5_PORTR|nr:hypothetical protein [Portunus trituberculatus]